MEIRLLENAEKDIFFEDFLSMMEKSDNDFIPPLSKRSSTTQTNLKAEEGAGTSRASVRSYLEEMIGQKILVCMEENNLLGFVSFKENYVSDIYGEESLPNIYLSTLILDERARGKGLTKKMYSYLFNDLYPDRNILTRTWSTNIPHIKILSGFDAEEIKRIPNDRGEGIDTVYFAKIRK